MKILITGSSGFIGFTLALKLLEKGHKIYGYDSMNHYYDIRLKNSRLQILKKYKNFKFSKGLLENQKKLKKILSAFKPEFIVHLAAQAGVRYSLKEPRKYLSSNIIGTYNIIEMANKIKVKHLLIASTSSAYGANTKTPFKETDKSDTQLSIYAATKKATESIAHSYSSLWKLPITMLRFFTVYGPWGRPDMALFKFTKKILRKDKIDIYNKGEMYRDFTYIDDVVKSVELLIKKIPKLKSKKKFTCDSISKVAPFRIVNIGNQNKIYLKHFVKELENILKMRAKKKLMPMQKGDVKLTLSDTKLLKSLTGFVPKTSYKKGIRNFVEWYKSYYSIKL